MLTDAPEDIARDIAAISRIGAVPALLQVVCRTTGMGFAAVARVTDGTWTACAVQDDIAFGLKPGSQLDVHTTLCKEVRAARQPVVIDHASRDPVYASHHTPRMYNIESYISVPIILRNGEYFGNLCAIDPAPRDLSTSYAVTLFTLFAELIAVQLELEERHRATESDLLDARATAELREQFIAVLGHDLRNPLAAVSAAGEVLSRRREPDLVQIGGRLRSITRRMTRLIDDVMDFARGRLGSDLGVTLSEGQDLAAAIHDVVAEVSEANPGRTVIDQTAIDGRVRCDRGRIQQLLSNLLSNAVAYGAPEHPVVVDGRIDGHQLFLRVSNRGEPIAPDNLRRIFEPYWRPPTSVPGGGLGLGLHICSQIVRAHGGTLDVTSSEGDGTRFVVRLPTGA